MNDAKQIYDQINNLLLHCKLYEAETLATEATRIFPQNYSIAERLAHVQLRREKYFDAEQNYKAIISKFRDRIHAWIGLINTLLLQGKIMDAESVANDAMTLFHKEFSILERVADVQFRKGMHREAQKSYESIIDRFPDKAQAWVGLTNVLLSQDKISDAEMVAGEAIILFPGEYSVLERFAHTLHRKGMHCYAERIFRIIIDRYPDKTNGWIGLTNVLLSQDKLDEAEGVAGKAKALFPEDFPVLERFAHTLHRRGKRRAAEEAYKHLIERYPDKTNGWIGLTNVLLSQGKLDEAEGVAGKAKALFPEDFPALERFAHTLHRGGKRRAAEEAYKLLINRFPDKTHGWIGLTNLLLSQDKPDEAESVALRAKVLFPDDFPTLERCAHLRHRKGMYRDAEVAYRTLSERYPEKVQAWTGLTNALLVQNKLEEAESVARNAAALFPNEFSALERHAHCCLRNNKFNDSNRTYRSIDRLLTLPAQYHDFASALEHLGEHEEAKRIYKLALNKLGNHPILINGFSNFLSRSGDNQSLMDFIDATYFCSSKKTALIIGNCQSIAMSSILELHEEFTSEYSIINSIPPIHEMSIELQHFVSDMLLPRIDLLVTQDLLNLHCPLKTNVAKGIAQSTIVFPTFHFTGYFPDMVTLKTDDATPRNAPLTNYHSALIVTSYFDGVTPEDCAKRLTSGDWIERGYRTYLSSLFEELYHRERHWDVKFTDNLYKSYKSGILFHTFNHPNACLLHDAANSLLGILGMGRLPQHIVNATSDRLNYIQWLVNEKIRNELSLVQNGSACFSIYSAKISAVDFVRSHYQHYETNSLIVEKCIDICRKAIFSWQE